MGKKRLTVLAPILAGVALLLSSCSGTPVSSPASSAQNIKAEREYSPEDLVRVLEQFAQGFPESNVLSDQQLRDSIPDAEAWLKELEVSPEECGLSITAPLGEQLEHATMAALQIEDSFITLAAYSDATLLAQSFEAEEQRNERCSRYTVLKGGQRVAFHMAEQELPTEAQKSAAHVLTSSDGTVASQQVMLKAADENLMMTISQPLHKESQSEQFAELAGQVNELFAALD